MTDSGLNAIVHVDPVTEAVKPFPLPADTPNINMNTAAFDGKGILWFTGQSGYYGSVDPTSETVTVWEARAGVAPTALMQRLMAAFFTLRLPAITLPKSIRKLGKPRPSIHQRLGKGPDVSGVTLRASSG